MKPLPSAPPTLEDSDIWLSIVVGYGLDWATAGVIFRDADRRDAAMMLRLAYMRSLLASEGRARYPRGYHRVIAHTVLSGHCALGKDPGTAFNIPGCA